MQAGAPSHPGAPTACREGRSPRSPMDPGCPAGSARGLGVGRCTGAQQGLQPSCPLPVPSKPLQLRVSLLCSRSYISGSIQAPGSKSMHGPPLSSLLPAGAVAASGWCGRAQPISHQGVLLVPPGPQLGPGQLMVGVQDLPPTGCLCSSLNLCLLICWLGIQVPKIDCPSEKLPVLVPVPSNPEQMSVHGYGKLPPFLP